MSELEFELYTVSLRSNGKSLFTALLGLSKHKSPMHEHNPLISRGFTLISPAEVLIAASPASSYVSDKGDGSLPWDTELSVRTVLYSNVLSNSDNTVLLSTASALLLAPGSTELPAGELSVTTPSSPDDGYFLSKASSKLEKRSLTMRLPRGDVASRGSVSAALSYSVVSVSEKEILF
jgi:hypothetical protein